ncbi:MULTISPECIES: NAD(P)H-dependent oxidoreductase [Pseudomonas]|uniref:NAD(P)H-dependent oxidoreductase n=1 Tax=Pseudomonas TaxID=286 RepID=UPI0008774A62|nr:MULTISPECIES: NAD(P)H-dependent oxidoreductase [Pseudomonas]TFA84835.1 NAD(P)H dehydrogenase (quinone) [Pseudomonas sp. LAIL14HWK12:I2]SCZ30825.1 NAD(P)H dehydrogenase (quinone) [Pseudomonas sp. NFIX46]SDB23747.1 NAD(P)H dehydrogenase (quinone) [Pseudomonas putida]SFQ93320.1 NAD(P)H dehydrogenase (quinone) [Pseudomonas sp. NFIX49]
MHALIVVDHDDPRSLTRALAQQIAKGLSESDPSSTFEIADLHAEEFDPRFGVADWAVHHRESAPPADVLAEQARIDRADVLVLVYPVFWWSMPALLKGWIDRVFSNGWAYDFDGDKTLKKLGRLRVHLVGLGGADVRTYERHGYGAAMKTQIDHGIFDYCGATVAGSALLLESESSDPAVQLQAAREMGLGLFR